MQWRLFLFFHLTVCVIIIPSIQQYYEIIKIVPQAFSKKSAVMAGFFSIKKEFVIIVQDLMSGIETVSSSCVSRRVWSRRETPAARRTEILSDLQCHCPNVQERMVEVVGKRMELVGI